MKRLSLLVAIFLIATIGGAYAAFIYPGAQGNATSEHTRAIYLESATQSGNIGDFAISSNITRISMDQTSHDENLVSSNYNVKMKFEYSAGSYPEISLTFTPKAGASEDIKTNGKTTYVYLGFVTDHVYDDPSTPAADNIKIFDVPYDKEQVITIHPKNYSTALGANELKWGEPDVNGVFTVQLTMINTEEMLVKLTQNFELDSIEKYEAFKTALGDTFVNLVVTATTVPLS